MFQSLTNEIVHEHLKEYKKISCRQGHLVEKQSLCYLRGHQMQRKGCR